MPGARTPPARPWCRFSQALGFDGFPELQEAARDEYKRRTHAPGGAPGDGSESALLTLGNSEFETALATDLVNLDESARRLELDDIQAVAGLIARTERVVMVGVDQMAFFASYLRHLLALLDLRAEVVASASQEALARLARIDEDTLVIAFCSGRPHALVLRAAKLARKRECSTVAVSDASISELTKLSDHCLYYSSNSPSYTRSHTALLSLIQALAYAVYSSDEAAYRGADPRLQAEVGRAGPVVRSSFGDLRLLAVKSPQRPSRRARFPHSGFPSH